MKPNKELKKSFYTKLNLTEEFWKLDTTNFEKYIDKKEIKKILENTKFSKDVPIITDIETIKDLMCFFPQKNETNQIDSSFNIEPFSYVQVFKNRSNFIDCLYKHIKDEEKDIAVMTLDRYGVDDKDIKANGPFIHSNNMLLTFKPKTYRPNQKNTFWPWFNFGTAFFVSLDLSWAIYTTNIDDNSLIIFLSNKEFKDKFFHQFPETLKHIFKPKRNKEASLKERSQKWEEICNDDDFRLLSFEQEDYKKKSYYYIKEFSYKTSSNENQKYYLQTIICGACNKITRSILSENPYREKDFCIDTGVEFYRIKSNCECGNGFNILKAPKPYHKDERAAYCTITNRIEIVNPECTLENPKGFKVKQIWKKHIFNSTSKEIDSYDIHEEYIKLGNDNQVYRSKGNEITCFWNHNWYYNPHLSMGKEVALTEPFIKHLLGENILNEIKGDLLHWGYKCLLNHLRFPSLEHHSDIQFLEYQAGNNFVKFIKKHEPKTIIEFLNLVMEQHSKNKSIRK